MLTILIPTIGRKETIARAINSACLSDEKLVKEIIILNNSQDEGFSLFLKSFIEGKIQDKRVSTISYEKRCKMGESWTIGANNSKYEWILYLHDDDELKIRGLTKEKFEKIISKEPEASFICFDYYLSDKRTKQIKRNQFIANEDPFTSIINDPPKYVSTIINKKQLKKINGWHDRFGYFLDFVGFIELQNVSPAIFTPDVIGVYYKHENNLSLRENRAQGYGDYIPKTLERCFLILGKSKHRSLILTNVNNFTYDLRMNIICRWLSKFHHVLNEFKKK